MSMDSYYNGIDQFSWVIYLPVIMQIAVGAALVAAGVLILVLGRRRYIRRYGK